MENSVVLEKVKVILINVLKHDNFEFRDDLSAPEVKGWDSLSHMMIITEIESAFNIKFKLKELNKIKNIRSLVDLIQSKL